MFLANTKNRGFTLLEISVVVIIIGIVLSTVSTVLPTLVRSSKAKQTDAMLSRFEIALNGYFVSNGRLPCPDTGSDGFEDRVLNTPSDPADDECSSYVGNIPSRTLGISSGNDALNHPIKYGVYRELISTTPATGTITNRVCDRLHQLIEFYDPALPLPAGSNPPNTSRVYTATVILSGGTSNPSNVGYVIVSGGSKNLDGNGGNDNFDGLNEGLDFDFDNPDRIEYHAPSGSSTNNDYDDQVRTASFQYLSGLICSGAGGGAGGTSNPVPRENDFDNGNGCWNTLDDDNDGVSDCDDPDCQSTTYCQDQKNALKIITTTLPSADMNGAYNATLEASGGNPSSYKWYLDDPGGVTGLSIPNASNPRLLASSINACPGTYKITVHVEDGVSISPPKDLPFIVGTNANLLLYRTSGDTTSNITWSLASQTEKLLASGAHRGDIKWTLSGASGFFLDSPTGETNILNKSGTTAFGLYALTIKLEDKICSKNTISRTFNINVEKPSVGTPGIINNVSTLQFSTSAIRPKLTQSKYNGGNFVAYTASSDKGFVGRIEYIKVSADGKSFSNVVNGVAGTYSSPDKAFNLDPFLTDNGYLGVSYRSLSANGVAIFDFKSGIKLKSSATIKADSYFSCFPPFNSTNPSCFPAPDTVRLSSNVYAVAFQDYELPGLAGDGDGYVRTMTIDDNGAIKMPNPPKIFPNAFVNSNNPAAVDIRDMIYPSAIKVENAQNIYAVAYGIDGRLVTMKIMDDGAFATAITEKPHLPFIDHFRFENKIKDGVNITGLWSHQANIIHVRGKIYAIVWTSGFEGKLGTNFNGMIRTVEISDDGMISPLSEPYQFEGSAVFHANIINVANGYVAVVYMYCGPSGCKGIVQSLKTSEDGFTITKGTRYEYESGPAMFPSITNINDDVFGIAYEKEGKNWKGDTVGQGWIKTVTIKR